jgi:23S rRNA (adenine2503-C2)-methyltransferase
VETLDLDRAAQEVKQNSSQSDMAQPEKTHLVGLTRDELTEELRKFGIPEKALRMRQKQIWGWVYNRGFTDFAEMTNISKGLRKELAGAFTLERPEIIATQISKDGTRKWLIRYEPGVEIETVYIPEEGRGTLCISSQVGCTLTCTFCHTGTQKLVRNLSSKEIITQIMIARDELNDWHKEDPFDVERAITNVVMMGMGEPLYNFDNVKNALAIVSDGEGIQLSRRRITLSTSGVVPEIERCGDEMGVMLAISLHAVTNSVRNELVPINKKYPIDELLEACRTYPGATNAKRITFEYVMLKGVNDSVADAKELVRLLEGIPAKVNLIPFNPWEGSSHECSSWTQIEKFAQVLLKAGYASPIRKPRGRDIMAACGQLKSESVKIRASEKRKIEKEALRAS